MHQFFVVGPALVRLLLALLVSLSLAGCAASGALFPGYQAPTEDTAEVVFYRLDFFRAGGESVNVYVDDAHVGTLKNAGWLSVPVKPGNRALRLSERFSLLSRDVKLNVTTRAGEPVAVRVLPGGLSGMLPTGAGSALAFGPWTMQQVPSSLAADELKSLKRSQ